MALASFPNLCTSNTKLQARTSCRFLGRLLSTRSNNILHHCHHPRLPSLIVNCMSAAIIRDENAAIIRDENVVRRSGNWKPSSFDYDFVQSLTSDYVVRKKSHSILFALRISSFFYLMFSFFL